MLWLVPPAHDQHNCVQSVARHVNDRFADADGENDDRRMMIGMIVVLLGVVTAILIDLISRIFVPHGGGRPLIGLSQMPTTASTTTSLTTPA